MTYNFTTTGTTFSLLINGSTKGTWTRTTQGDSKHSIQVNDTSVTFSLQEPYFSEGISAADTIQINGVTQAGTIPERILLLKAQVFYLAPALVNPLSDYASDAAAATGLIPIGGLYHTAGAVKIRLA